MSANELLERKIVTIRGRQTSVRELLLGMSALRASELFLKSGGPPRFKIAGRVTTFDGDTIDRDGMDHVLRCFLGDEARQRFYDMMVADLVHQDEKARYRVHFGYGQTGPYGAIRIIGRDIRPFPQLNLPPAVQESMLSLRSGLIVICGTTDAGKTVTCTSYLDHINRTKEVSILTLEDPVEYILEDVKSVVIQREVGTHVPSFAEGLRSALRENVDVMFVGEMRDLETIQLVLRAAETGHLVISTLHADDALSALMRMIGSFPPGEQPRIRQSLASSVAGVVYQRLLPTVDGGRAPCIEAFWPNNAVRTIVRGGDLTKLGSYVGKATGGLEYRDSLQGLLRDGRISRETFDEDVARLRQGA